MQWLITRIRLRQLHDREHELCCYIRNVIFDYEIWLELLDESRTSAYKLGPIELGKADLSFKQRVASLFKDYQQLAGKKSLQPFPGWYRKMYRSGSQRNNQYVDHFWQYALAQVLRKEFFELQAESVVDYTCS
ncbi:MAG: hypothetical protein M3R04_06060 [bacterium]|nr:hypothetical protein [bacterium]